MNVGWDRSSERIQRGIQSYTERSSQHGGLRAVAYTIDIQTTSILHFRSELSLPGSKNEMDTAVGLDDIAHFSNLQGKGGFFKRPLHLPGTKFTEISAFLSRAAVREFFCELGEFIVGPVDLGLISLEDLNRFGL